MHTFTIRIDHPVLGGECEIAVRTNDEPEVVLQRILGAAKRRIKVVPTLERIGPPLLPLRVAEPTEEATQDEREGCRMLRRLKQLGSGK